MRERLLDAVSHNLHRLVVLGGIGAHTHDAENVSERTENRRGLVGAGLSWDAWPSSNGDSEFRRQWLLIVLRRVSRSDGGGFDGGSACKGLV